MLCQMWLPVLVWVAVAQGSAKPLGALQGDNSPIFLSFPLSFLRLTFSRAQVLSGRPDSYQVSRELLTRSAFSTQSCRGSPQQPRAQQEEAQQQQQQQQQHQRQREAQAPQPQPQRRTFH